MHYLSFKMLFFIVILFMALPHSFALDLSKRFVISLASKHSTLDPQKDSITPDLVVASHLFNTLIRVDENGDMVPSLAAKYEKKSSKVWELTLKQGVKFHDGSELTTKDVIFTFERLKALYGDRSLASYLSEIIAYKALDKYRLELITQNVLNDIGSTVESIHILKAAPLPYPSEADFLSGKRLIGTGPYKFVSFTPTGGLMLDKFEAYYDKQDDVYLKHIELSSLPSKEDRLKAFLAGKVDMIDELSLKEIQAIRDAGRYRFNQFADDRLLHLHLDSVREHSPFIRSLEGKAIANPLKHLKVRQALSKAIDRTYLTEVILDGSAIAASQLIKTGRPGYNEGIKVDEYSPHAAKQLLQEAGYAEGFKLTLHGPNDRYPNEVEVLGAIAKMWSAIGVDTTVNTAPKSEYFPKAVARTFSAGLLGYHTYGRMQEMLIDLLVISKPDDVVHMGAWNLGGYNNPEVTRRLLEAMKNNSKAQRLRLLRDASEIVIRDQAIIPLYFPMLTWATKHDVVYWPDSGATAAWRIKSASD